MGGIPKVDIYQNGDVGLWCLHSKEKIFRANVEFEPVLAEPADPGTEKGRNSIYISNCDAVHQLGQWVRVGEHNSEI